MADEGGYKSSFVQGDDRQLALAVKEREKAVASLIGRGGDPVKALHEALKDPPYATRTETVKESSYAVVGMAIAAIKDADIAAAVGNLSMEECDVLMKYIYRG